MDAFSFLYRAINIPESSSDDENSSGDDSEISNHSSKGDDSGTEEEDSKSSGESEESDESEESGEESGESEESDEEGSKESREYESKCKKGNKDFKMFFPKTYVKYGKANMKVQSGEIIALHSVGTFTNETHCMVMTGASEEIFYFR